MSNDEQPPAMSMADLGASLPGLTGADRAGLANALKQKLDSLAGVSSGYIESLPPNIRKRVVALQEIQKEHNEHEAKFFEERAALEAKYQKLYEPLYTKRFDIVNGVVDVESPTPGSNEAPATGNTNATEEKGVPDFWLIAMKTNDILSDEITKRDEGPLKYLKDIRSFNLEGERGFKLEFYFAENPYFKNTVLTKVYHMAEDDDPILEKATGTKIEWYPGKNVTQKVLQKKPKKGAKNQKPVTKIEDCESFFNFFDPPKVPEDDEDLDEEAAEHLQGLMEQDYDIGSTIKDKIIPHAVSWFTGEALQGEEFEEGEDEAVEDDEDEEDDDEEDDEDDDDEEEDDDESEEHKGSKPAFKSKPKKPSVQAKGEQPPECKQQ
ncbi:hypothetical protein KP509_32G047400 [Ceratopteris richardii]|uniref:Nucleosome assembly protein 1 n=1 Tax=Ceratopteris richardii TaxID=49495 RepID=A0A8T2QTN4_CERRI|nr:hypothetical protein KP509_32G047400 [Ceratopteris richardii]